MNIQNRLETFSALLWEWNQIHNLSAIKDKQDIQEQIIDSVRVLDFVQTFQSCLDIGSGAGFPALPLSVCCPKARFILVEPNAKRAAFLHHVKGTLGLENVQIQRSRIQELNPLEVRKVDLITSRAVMSAPDLMVLSAPFLNKKGHFLFYKGSHLRDEVVCSDHECFVYGKRVYFYRQRRHAC